MTSDQKKFINMSNYKGSQVVVTENNSKRSMTRISKTMFVSHQSSATVKLQNIYHVLGIKRNYFCSIKFIISVKINSFRKLCCVHIGWLKGISKLKRKKLAENMLETIGNIDNMSLKQLEIVSCVQKVACVEILSTIESVSKIHH